MPVPACGIWRSITGRLYVAMGVTLIALIATNVQTMVYTHQIARSADAVATTGITGVRAADDFDDLLDQHRRALVAAAADPAATAAGLTRLTEIERRLRDSPALSGAGGAPSGELAVALRQDIAELEGLARGVLRTVSDAGQEADDATSAYMARNNATELDVTAWKTRMREMTADQLGAIGTRTALMRRVYQGLTLGGLLVGTLAMLIGRSILVRLNRLTAAMLALAAGEVATPIPFLKSNDEIGLLADALEVFRNDAGRIMVSEANMSVALENMVEGIILFSASFEAVLHNQKAIELFGLPCCDCKGMMGSDMLDHLSGSQGWPAEVTSDLARRLAGIRKRGGSETFDIELPDQRSFTITAALLPSHHLLLSLEDTTERRASAARIFHLAHHDALTELPNRAMFQQHLSAAVDDVLNEQGLGVALLVCDLDRFKEVNDTYGHPAGDELLRQASRRMRETMRKTDVLARLGGDEFAIVHLIGTDPDEAAALATRIVTALTQPFDVHGSKVCIGASIGIARVPADAGSLSELMKRADLALYAAKQGGRSRFVVYDPIMAEKLEERHAIAIEMRTALETGAFHLHYQPQVDLRTRRILGFEALARWSHPVRGAIGPITFIPMAEESGLIVQLGEWALRTACRDAAGWDADTTISVNVSPCQFREEGFVEAVRSALHDSGLSASRLELEITESAMLNDGEKILSVLETLHAMGVRLSLDDFGTGYSALSYLQKFPFDKIKIDQSFVRELGAKDESDAIVRAVAALGVNLGMATVAEGIETEEQARLVLRAACEEGQGYLFSRPIPPDEVPDLLARQREGIYA